MELKFILESILFSAQKPMSTKELRDVLATAAAAEGCSEEVKQLKKAKDEDITGALEQLQKDHETAQRSYRLACVAGAWQFVTQPEFAPWLIALVGAKVRPPRLSQPGLETLAIIAYRQPITRAEIEQIRGVAVDGVMQTLLERGLVEQVGRAEVIGRPMMYGTTPFFLQYFGLSGLDSLPEADELRRIPVTKPEGLPTAEPGLATPAAPDQLPLVEQEKLADNSSPAPETQVAEPVATAESPEPVSVAPVEPNSSPDTLPVPDASPEAEEPKE